MSEARRAAIWIIAASLTTAVITFLLSIHGSSFISGATGLRGPAAYGGGLQLVALQVVGALVASSLAFAAVRFWSASQELWFGALITSILLGARLAVDPIGLWLWSARAGDDFAASRISEIVHGFPFVSPWAAAVAVVGYPLAVGLACWAGRPRASHA